MGQQVTFYLSYAQVEELDDLAHAGGITRSALLSDIVKGWLKEPQTETKGLASQQLDGMSTTADLQARQFVAFRAANAGPFWDNTDVI